MSQHDFCQGAESHERYEMMCALAAVHELDPSEQQLFDSHLSDCDRCQAEFESFRAVTRQLADKSVDAPALDEKAHGVSFTKFATSHGLVLSRAARKALANDSLHTRWVPTLAYAAAAVVLFVGATALLLKTHFERNLGRPMIAGEPSPLFLQPTSTNGDGDRIAQLESRLKNAERQAGEIPQLEEKLEAAEKSRSSFESLLVRRDSEIGQLKTAIADSQERLGTAGLTIASLNSKNADLTAELVAEHARSASLSDELRDQKAATEQEQEFTAATREVRDLMGARRLFMIDVYDGDDRERANRSFGRVFYTEGKSLIFYAFDLDKKRTPKRVTFTAWGQRGKDSATIKQLGVFQIDDPAQNRWVMKVDDPYKLRSIDAIFVTIESRPAPEKPTGQKLLYAYLGGQPNHP